MSRVDTEGSTIALTWAELDDLTEKILDDEGGEFNTTGSTGEIRRELESAELLLALHRMPLGCERTQNLTLSASTPMYQIRSVQSAAFSDFIWPLRITIGSVPIHPDNLNAIQSLHSDWHSAAGTPESYYMWCANFLGFYPVESATAKVTYLRRPPTAQSSGSPIVAPEFHEILATYAAGVILASTGKLEEGQNLLEIFFKSMGIPTDDRFGRHAAQQQENKTELNRKVMPD
jgi:hypothetical protein